MSKIKQEFILLIMNCQKYKEKAIRQKQTWLPFLPSNVIYFHVIGDQTLNQPYMIIENDNLLVIKTEDDYNHLPKKVINAYEIINSLYDFKYIYKTDDDQLLQTTKFFSLINSTLLYNENVHYGGFMISVKEDQISDYYKFHAELPKDLIIKKNTYCNGRFYLLSNSAVINLLESKTDIEKEYFEDYAIGYYLNQKYKTNFLKLQTSQYFKDMVM